MVGKEGGGNQKLKREGKSEILFKLIVSTIDLIITAMTHL